MGEVFYYATITLTYKIQTHTKKQAQTLYLKEFAPVLMNAVYLSNDIENE